MDSISAQCGHVKRQLRQNQALNGKVLDFALSVIGEEENSSGAELLREIARKLRSGETLSDYEFHITVDVLLLHKRLEVR